MLSVEGKSHVRSVSLEMAAREDIYSGLSALQRRVANSLPCCLSSPSVSPSVSTRSPFAAERTMSVETLARGVSLNMDLGYS